MSTVVGAVKSRLRSRSRHRYSSRSVSGENEAHNIAAPPLPANSNNNGNLRQQALGEGAMGARGSSLDHKNLPDVPNETESSGRISPTKLAQSLDQPRDTSASYNNPTTVPDRFSSLPKSQRPGTADGNTQSQSHCRVASQPMSRPTTSDAMAQPPSPTSPRVQRKPMPPAKDGTNRRSLDTSIPSSQMEGMSLYTTPSGQRTSDEDTRGRVAGHRTARSTDLAPNDPSPLIPRFANQDHEKAMRSAKKYTPEQLPPNLRLPQDFRLGHSERTYVDTEWLPAVTRERIHHQKTEVIYPAIERDIHVHHYYQYSQVILVQEVLPARHFKLDKESGRKIEIPAPPGWEMPTKLTPQQPDTSELKQWTRHYLINDQHPNGVDEAPPTEENKQKYASRTGVQVA